jgi:non-specific serine/threonine protein kinase
LRVPGETEWPVPPLARPDNTFDGEPETLAGYDAVRLLVERARDVRPGFGLTMANAPAVAQICTRLDGLPLALELAAARLRVLSPEQVAARLGDQLELLTEGGRTRPGRQQTLRATLDWSYDLLAPEERALLQRLSVFAGGFTLDAATVVAGEEKDVLDPLERLVSKSLVALDNDRPEPRFRLLEPIRQYAAERLRHANLQQELLCRHRDWVVRFAEDARRKFAKAEREWSARLRDEQDNVRQALEVSFARGDTEAALRIAAALGSPWYTMGQPDASVWLARAVETAAGAPDKLRARVLLEAGQLAQRALDYDRAASYLREALALFRGLGARLGEATTLLILGRAAQAVEVESRSSTSWLSEALDRFRDLNEPAGAGWAHFHLGLDAFNDGDIDRAADCAVGALELGAKTGVLQLLTESQRLMGMVTARRGDHAESERFFSDAAAAYREAGDRWQLAMTLSNMAWFAFERGEHRLALERLSEALRLSRESGARETMNWVLQDAICVLWRSRPREAAMMLGATDATRALRQYTAKLRAEFAPSEAELARGEVKARRDAGRSLSIERAADLALRTVEEELAVAARLGAEESPAAEVPKTARPGIRVFRREGDYWTIAYGDTVCRLKDVKGLQYLAQLLRHPGREFHVLDLAQGACVGEPASENPRPAALPILDEQAKAAYRHRLTDLRDELAEAERFHDAGRAARAREEIDAITEQLAAGVGLGGRDRVASATAERARSTVTHAIRAVVRKIHRKLPAVGEELALAIRTGTYCSYAPDRARPVDWTL